MTRHYTQWTLPELRRVSARRMDGEKWATIEEDYQVGRDAIRRALQRNGLGIGLRHPKDDRRDEALILKATRLRNERWTWPDIKEVTGWTKTTEGLRKACHVAAEQKGGKVWLGRGEP